MSGLSGLSLQVIYTPARLSGSNKAFYVQINSVVGAQPSSALGQMSWGQWGERWRRQGGRLCSYCHWGEERTQGGNTIHCCILITRPLTEDFFWLSIFLQIVFFNIKLQVMTYHSPKSVLFTSCSTLVLIKTVILRTIHWVWIKVWSNSFNQDSDEKRGLAARQVPTPRLVRGLGMLQQSAQTKLDTIIEQRPPIISITPYGAEDEERDTKSTLTCTELQRARPSPEADKLPAVRFSPNLQAAACTARRGAFFSPKKTEKKKHSRASNVAQLKQFTEKPVLLISTENLSARSSTLTARSLGEKCGDAALRYCCQELESFGCQLRVKRASAHRSSRSSPRLCSARLGSASTSPTMQLSPLRRSNALVFPDAPAAAQEGFFSFSPPPWKKTHRMVRMRRLSSRSAALLSDMHLSADKLRIPSLCSASHLVCLSAPERCYRPAD